MECNKDEAIRVTHIAELKFKKGDLVGAKRFILKALRLYSCLDGAIQLSAVLDVHIAAQVKVGINEPESDYYGILQVKPLSDDSTIKLQYRNLSKLVHPDKNKESMKEKSEAAFKLISKAFEVLSDEETRSQHDSKRGGKPTAKEPPKPTYSTQQPQPQQRDVKWGGMPRANPQPQAEPRKATYSAANQPRHQGVPQPTPAPGAQASQAPNTFWTPPASPAPGAQAFQAPYTFWTACPVCRMQYQCMSIFLNYQVVCQKCHSSFPANDINVHPANGASAFAWPPGPSGTTIHSCLQTGRVRSCGLLDLRGTTIHSCLQTGRVHSRGLLRLRGTTIHSCLQTGRVHSRGLLRLQGTTIHSCLQTGRVRSCGLLRLQGTTIHSRLVRIGTKCSETI